MTGILIILFCWCVGNLLGTLTGGYVSGNVIGMLLLYVALHFRLVKAEKVAPTAKFLLGVMAILFVPFGVGLMESYEVLADSWLAIVVSCALSTWLVIATVAFIYQKLNKRS